MSLLALIAFCAVVTTLSLLVTANSLWRTSHRLDLLLCHGDAAVREARRALGSARQLLARTNRAAAGVGGILDPIFGFAQGFFGNHRGARHVANKRRLG